MFSCEDCKRKRCLTSGKPCDRVEKLLPKLTSGQIGWGKERSFADIEIIATKRAFRLKYGRPLKEDIED